MISMGEITFVVIIQTIIILIILSSLLLFLLYKKQQHLKKYMGAEAHDYDTSPAPTVEHYLTTEIKLTEGRFNSFYQDEDCQKVEFGEPDWLMLRKKYLELEKELSTSSEREDPFWTSMGKDLKRIIGDSHLVKRLKVEEAQDDAEDEIQELRRLMKEQNNEFESLISGLEDESSQMEAGSLKEKLTKLSRSHTELSQCVSMLEDENMFLRDQIKGLLDS